MAEPDAQKPPLQGFRGRMLLHAERHPAGPFEVVVTQWIATAVVPTAEGSVRIRRSEAADFNVALP